MAQSSWAAEYQKRNVYKSAEARSSRRCRWGDPQRRPNRPFWPRRLSPLSDVRSVPGQDPLATKDEIAHLLTKLGLKASVELYHFRPGYEAKNIERLAETVRRAHRAHFGSEPPAAHVETSSMWRDLNVFNELGIPALTYGPRSISHSFKRALTIDSLYQAACLYARIAIDLCNQ